MRAAPERLETGSDAIGFVSLEAGRMRSAGGHPDLVVIVGKVAQDPTLDLWTALALTPSWQVVRETSVTQTPWLHGALAGVSVLLFQDEPEPALHLVDLTDYRYVQLDPEEQSPDDLHLEVRRSS